MTSVLFKEKKGVNISCVSPASTAICTSIDRRSMVQPSTGRALDRYTPHLQDPVRRAAKQLPVVCSTTSSHQPHTKHPLTRRNHSCSYGKRSSADSRATGAGTCSVPGSGRYLLHDVHDSGEDGSSSTVSAADGAGDDAYSNWLPDRAVERRQPPKALPPLISLEPPTLRALMGSEEPPPPAAAVSANHKPYASASPRTEQQVVVLRVSLHCKGCEGKVRKHISKMQGVASFDIDFARKKVTVVGDVTPLEVLSSISKVKRAQFWPSHSPPRASDPLL